MREERAFFVYFWKKADQNLENDISNKVKPEQDE